MCTAPSVQFIQLEGAFSGIFSGCLLYVGSNPMSLLEQSLIESSLAQFDVYRYVHAFRFELEEIWAPQEVFYQKPLPEQAEDTDRPLFSRRGPPPTEWAIAFTPAFRKSIAGIDKKLQGRILAAITDLSEEPASAHGDTIKPLSAELKGLWRYRVGDYRLVYKPDEEQRLVVLLEFAARGGIYES